MYVYDEYDQRIIEDRVKQFRDQTLSLIHI